MGHVHARLAERGQARRASRGVPPSPQAPRMVNPGLFPQNPGPEAARKVGWARIPLFLHTKSTVNCANSWLRWRICNVRSKFLSVFMIANEKLNNQTPDSGSQHIDWYMHCMTHILHTGHFVLQVNLRHLTHHGCPLFHRLSHRRLGSHRHQALARQVHPWSQVRAQRHCSF